MSVYLPSNLKGIDVWKLKRKRRALQRELKMVNRAIKSRLARGVKQYLDRRSKTI